MAVTSPLINGPQRRVRVWFGSSCIATHIADLEQARQYAALLRQRFRGLRVTIEPLSGDGHGARPLPPEWAWARDPMIGYDQ